MQKTTALPATPKWCGMLPTHFSSKNAESHGLDIKSEAVIDGKHTLYLIVEARDEKQVSKFMEPFARVGSVEVMAISLCEVVVKRGAC